MSQRLFSEKNYYTATAGATLAVGVSGLTLMIALSPGGGPDPLIGKVVMCSILLPLLWVIFKIAFFMGVEIYDDALLIKGMFYDKWIPFACLREIGPPHDLYFRTSRGDYVSLLLGTSVIGEIFGNKTNRRVRASVQSALDRYRSNGLVDQKATVVSRLHLNLRFIGTVYGVLLVISAASEFLR